MTYFARLPVGLRRRMYRFAYRLLCVYWFVRRPVSQGVKCVLTEGELVLLVRHTYGPPLWDLPGGAIRDGEKPAATARREMGEELGVDITGWQALGVVTVRQQHRNNVLHCFHAELREPALTLDLGELASARWFPRHALPPDTGTYTHPILDRLPHTADALENRPQGDSR